MQSDINGRSRKGFFTVMADLAGSPHHAISNTPPEDSTDSDSTDLYEVLGRKVSQLSRKEKLGKQALDRSVGDRKATVRNCVPQHVSKSKSSIFQCHICDASSKSRHGLRIHQSKAHGLQCVECSFVANNARKMALHVKLNHDEDVERQKCSMRLDGTRERLRRYSSVWSLRSRKPEDMLGKHKNRQITSKESICSLGSIGQGSQQNQSNNCTLMPKKKQIRKKQKLGYSCHICGKIYRNELSWKWHKKLHKIDRKYKCFLCPYQTDYSVAFRNHLEFSHKICESNSVSNITSTFKKSDDRGKSNAAASSSSIRGPPLFEMNDLGVKLIGNQDFSATLHNDKGQPEPCLRKPVNNRICTMNEPVYSRSDNQSNSSHREGVCDDNLAISTDKISGDAVIELSDYSSGDNICQHPPSLAPINNVHNKPTHESHLIPQSTDSLQNRKMYMYPPILKPVDKVNPQDFGKTRYSLKALPVSVQDDGVHSHIKSSGVTSPQISADCSMNQVSLGSDISIIPNSQDNDYGKITVGLYEDQIKLKLIDAEIKEELSTPSVISAHTFLPPKSTPGQNRFAEQASNNKSCGNVYLPNGQKLFSCNWCHIYFPNTLMFTQHIGLHNSLNPLQCNICMLSFLDYNNFNAHLVLNHG